MSRDTDHGPARRPRTDIVLLALRLFLGGVFVFAAWLKISDPQSFAESIKAFKILPDHLTEMAAFVVPWLEMVVAGALIFGVWTRSAGLLLSAQLAVFTVAIVSVVLRGLELSCGCFGDFEIPCQSPIGWCHVARNATLLVFALAATLFGAGSISIDGIVARIKHGLRHNAD